MPLFPRIKNALTHSSTSVELYSTTVEQTTDPETDMSSDIRLSEQQLQIVQLLNQLGEGTAKEVQQGLAPLQLAHTTVATVLSRLEKKGVLQSEVRGRERCYRSNIDDSELRRSMVSSLISNLFKGDPKALMAHLVSEGEFEVSELDALRELVQQHNKK